MPSPPPYPRPGYLVYRAARLFARLNEARLAPQGIAIGQVPVLASLSRSGSAALTQKALTEIADVEQPTMAQLLARMERDGLILRATDSGDRRTKLVRLTPAGEAAVPAVAESLKYVNDRAYAGFTEEEREAFSTLLLRMIANLEALEKSDSTGNEERRDGGSEQI